MLQALDLARRIDAGELGPADVVDLCAKAIDARETQVCAFAALDVARAKAKAQAAGLAARPLRGLPVGVKDIFDTVDFPTEFGTPIYQGNQPRADAALVALIRRAGGVLLGKMVTTEFAFLNPSKTHNPHDVTRSPGGSSAGSAASVAAGMLPITVGTQTGGSVIRPASYCGVAAFKPSYRLLPTAGIKPFAVYLDTAGLFAARVVDVAPRRASRSRAPMCGATRARQCRARWRPPLGSRRRPARASASRRGPGCSPTHSTPTRSSRTTRRIARSRSNTTITATR
jgi:Asp-tRNA(Asn)/Glu-tRNA(Gln) amidotransferase A subunit family amidase